MNAPGKAGHASFDVMRVFGPLPKIRRRHKRECTLRPPLRRMSGRQQPLRLRRFKAAACTTCCACILNVLRGAHRKTRDF